MVNEDWKPDFTKENPYEGMPDKYAQEVANNYVRTPDAPLNPVQEAAIKGQVSEKHLPSSPDVDHAVEVGQVKIPVIPPDKQSVTSGDMTGKQPSRKVPTSLEYEGPPGQMGPTPRHTPGGPSPDADRKYVVGLSGKSDVQKAIDKAKEEARAQADAEQVRRLLQARAAAMSAAAANTKISSAEKNNETANDTGGRKSPRISRGGPRITPRTPRIS